MVRTHSHTLTHAHMLTHTHSHMHAHTYKHTQITVNVNKRLTYFIAKIDSSILCIILNYTFVDTKLLLFSQRAGLKQIVPKAMQDVNHIDLVFMSHNNLMLNIYFNVPFSTSDHSSIKFNLAFVSFSIMYSILPYVSIVLSSPGSLRFR